MSYNCIVVSGFLESGKTHFINQYIKNKKSKILIVSTEQGVTSYESKPNITIKNVTQPHFNETLFDLDMYDEIIVEYNGTWVADYFLNLNIFKDIKVKWVHVIDGTTFDFYFRNMYDLMASQIINCDEVVINNTKNNQKIYEVLKMINPTLIKHNYVNYIIIGILLFVIWNQKELSKITTIFASILIQAIPFLLLGVMISSVIQFYFNENAFEKILKKFPK